MSVSAGFCVFSSVYINIQISVFTILHLNIDCMHGVHIDYILYFGQLDVYIVQKIPSETINCIPLMHGMSVF